VKNKKTYFRKKLLQYQQQSFSRLTGYLDEYAEKGKYKVLHKLRLEIKKITALINLLEYCRQMPLNPLQLKNLNKIFRLAGKVRSYKINKKIIAAFGDDSMRHLTGKNAAKAAKNKLRDAGKKYQRRMQQLNNTVSEQMAVINQQNLNAYLEGQLQHITSFQVNPHTVTLHALRKHIKEILNLYPLADGAMMPPIKKIQLARLDKLQDAIGQWHDINKLVLDAQNKPDKKIKTTGPLMMERKKRLRAAQNALSAAMGRSVHVKG
jgi:CHAD domain-containing protein